ncbi:MAG: TlpA disulfide reductase family protein [Pyrinomonadaceae bacterium]
MKRVMGALTLLLAVCAAAAGQQGEAGVDGNRPPLRNFRAVNGRIVRLDAYRGKVVLLNFWATWCPPCRAEMPELVKLQREYAGQLRIVGITYPPENVAEVRKLARRMKVNYPLVTGTYSVAGMFGVREVLPVTIILDRDGIIRGRIVGTLEPEEFAEKIKPLLH